MKRETTEEHLLALKEWLHELAGVVHEIALRVEILWRERNRRAGDRGGIRDE